jgi:phospholipase/carboxylesterase
MQPEAREINGWPIKVYDPGGNKPRPVILLLHGWTGDESVMWVFAERLPPDALMIAPRAPHSSTRGGYSWVPEQAGVKFRELADFLPAAAALEAWLKPDYFPQADFDRLSLVGFSQGAALSYTFGLTRPGRVRAIAGLAGFMPGGVEGLARERPLVGMPVFVTHGTADDIVPVGMARRSVELLSQAGADVRYCEADAGHKLGLACSRSLGAFFKEDWFAG